MAIQFLRGSGTSSTVLADGQPYYDKTNNLLYIGDGSTALSSLTALNKPYWMQYYYIYTTSLSSSNSSCGAVYLYIGFRIDTVLTHTSWYAGNSTDSASIWYALYSRGYSSYPVEYCNGTAISSSSSYRFDVIAFQVSNTTAQGCVRISSLASTSGSVLSATASTSSTWTCTMQQAIKLINN